MTNRTTPDEELVELIMKGALDGDYSLIEEGKARIEQLLNRVERLERALRPFAKAGELFAGPPTDFDQCIYAPAAGDEYALSGNDLREARAALTGEHNG